MCATKELYDSYNPCNNGSVIVANGLRSKVIEKGIINMKIYDGVIRIMGDVRFILNLENNLISLNRLDTLS